jgi:hypothetical protein
MNDQITFKCTKCGSAEFIFPNQPPRTTDIIKCAGCEREVGRYDAIREALRKAGRKEIEKVTMEAFGKRPK